MYTKIKTWLKSKKNGILALSFSVILVITLAIPCGAVWYTDIPNNVGRSVSGRWLMSGGDYHIDPNAVKNHHLLEGAFAISNDSSEATNPLINKTFSVNYDYGNATSTADISINNWLNTISLNKSVPRHTAYNGNNYEKIKIFNDSIYYCYDFINFQGDIINVSFINDLQVISYDDRPNGHINLSFTLVDLLSFNDGEFTSYDITHSVDVLDYYNASEDLYLGTIDLNTVIMSYVGDYAELSLCRIDNLAIEFAFDVIRNQYSMPFYYSLSVEYDLTDILEFYYKSDLIELRNNNEINQFVVDMVYNEAYQEPIPIPPPTEQYLRSYVDWITTAVSGFFSFELFPGFYLGGLIVAVVAFCLVMWWLKMFGGG